jgi:hypothetical protein
MVTVNIITVKNSRGQDEFRMNPSMMRDRKVSLIGKSSKSQGSEISSKEVPNAKFQRLRLSA